VWIEQGKTARAKPIIVNSERAYSQLGLTPQSGGSKKRTPKERTNNPANNFVKAGATANNRENRKKVVYILSQALKNATDVPKHVFAGAQAIRLWNPMNLSSKSGGELENNGIKNGVRAAVRPRNTTPNSGPNASRPNWVRHTSPNGSKTVDVVDFRLGEFEANRDTGINMLNLIFEEYIPKNVMPWDDLSQYTPRTHPTYFIKARFDLNPIKSWANANNLLNKRETTVTNKKTKAKTTFVKKAITLESIGRYKTFNARGKNNFKKLLQYTNVNFRTNSKGTEDWEPDAIYYDGKGVLHFIELKITEGKAETFPAEAVQLVKGKKLAELILNFNKPRVSSIKLYFIPWRFGTKYPIDFRNWKTAATVRDPDKQAALTDIARIAGVLGRNYDPIPVYNNVGGNRRREAFPNVNSSIINARLSTLRSNRIKAAQATFNWVNAKSLIALWSIPAKRNGLKQLMYNWGSVKNKPAAGGVSASSQEYKLWKYTVDIFTRWVTGKSRNTLRNYLPENQLNFPNLWGKYENGVWHTKNAVGWGRISTKQTKNAPAEEVFAENLEEAVSVWTDFHEWRLKQWPGSRPDPALDKDLEFFQKLNEGLQKRRREQEAQASNANLNAFFAAGNKFATVYEKFLKDHIGTRPAKAANARTKLNARINANRNAASNNNKPAYNKMKKLKAKVDKKIFG
jgi:hypothetical protein